MNHKPPFYHIHYHFNVLKRLGLYNAFNVYRRELAPGTVSLTGDRTQGDDSKHWADSNNEHFSKKEFLFKSFVKIEISHVFTINMFSTAENCMEK